MIDNDYFSDLLSLLNSDDPELIPNLLDLFVAIYKASSADQVCVFPAFESSDTLLLTLEFRVLW